MRRRTIIVLALIAVIIVFFSGPREPVETTLATPAVPALEALEQALARAESDVADLRPGAGKEIVWADPARPAKTAISIVYVHGFSATKEELRPLPDDVAGALGANLYFTRLTGHGRNGSAMAEAQVNDWLNDLAEALAVGRQIGDRVVLMATSTGASLAVWGAGRPALSEELAALVLISPNFGLADPSARMLTWPWARQLIRLVVGETYAFEPDNEGQARWWTTRYPSSALLPMAAAARLAREAPLETITLPALFAFAPGDQVVSAALIEEAHTRWGGVKAVERVTNSTARAQHVIAGRIMSPTTTAPLAARITNWLAEQI